jgi:hypothetical protein
MNLSNIGPSVLVGVTMRVVHYGTKVSCLNDLHCLNSFF